MLVEVLTDNRNRAASDVRYVFSKNGGKLGTTGSVAYLFERKGVILIPSDAVDEDELMELALEAGAEDVELTESDYRVVTTPEDFTAVRDALREAGVSFENAEITMQPQNSVELEAGTAKQTLRLIDALEEKDDVQEVYANFDVSDEVMAVVAGEVGRKPQGHNQAEGRGGRALRPAASALRTITPVRGAQLRRARRTRRRMRRLRRRLVRARPASPAKSHLPRENMALHLLFARRRVSRVPRTAPNGAGSRPRSRVDAAPDGASAGAALLDRGLTSTQNFGPSDPTRPCTSSYPALTGSRCYPGCPGQTDGGRG